MSRTSINTHIHASQANKNAPSLKPSNSFRLFLSDVVAIESQEVSFNRKREMNGDCKHEPLLKKDCGIDSNEFSIVYNDIWELYLKAQASMWTSSDLDLSNDRSDWLVMSRDEKRYFTHTFSVFSAYIQIIRDHHAMNFCCEIQSTESQCFLGSQIAMANIHADVSLLFLDNFRQDDAEQTNFISLCEISPGYRKKVAWMMQWCNRSKFSFAERVLALVIIEGLFFSSSFCSIFWFRRRNMLPGVISATENIARDMGIHFDFACLLYNKLANPLAKQIVYKIIGEAVEMECDFLRESLPVELIGIDSGEMTQYVLFCANRLLLALNYDQLYNLHNPFDWMDSEKLRGKRNIEKKYLQSDFENYQVFNYQSSSSSHGSYTISFDNF